MDYVYFIGIDMSKDFFDMACHGEAHSAQRFVNSAAGYKAMLKSQKGRLAEMFVVVEATGGYETALIEALLRGGVAVHRATPLSAKHYLRSLRLHAKTDALDAAALARYGAERHAQLPLETLPSAAQKTLALLLTRRADLVAMRVAEQQRLKHPRYREITASLRRIIATLTAEIASLEARIEAEILASEPLTAKMNTLTSVKGVGKHTAYTLLACMPELGQLTRRQAASLAGCAPHPRDSGNSRGYRKTVGGRAIVKRALFLAAMAARRFHPDLRAFYEHLIQNGKKPMVALTALMRKLIIILNAKIRNLALAQ